MKIDNNNPNPLAGAADALTQTPGPAPAGSEKAGPAASTSADQLTLSPTVQLLKTATDAAAVAPDVRQDVVERMRALLERGEVGADAGRLADAIIDDVLKDK